MFNSFLMMGCISKKAEMCLSDNVLFYCPHVMLQQKDHTGQKCLQPSNFHNPASKSQHFLQQSSEKETGRMPFIRPLQLDQVSILESDTLKSSPKHTGQDSSRFYLYYPALNQTGQLFSFSTTQRKTEQHHYSETCTRKEEFYSSIVPSLAIIVGLRVEAQDSLFGVVKMT